MRRLKKIKSFRDLGGIECANGKKVVFGRLLRSGHHGSLKAGQALWLKLFYNVYEIIDLRANEEVADNPDKMITGVKYIHIPLLTDEQNPVVNRRTRGHMLRKVIEEGGAITHLCEVYRTLVSSELSLHGLHEIFTRLLTDHEGAFLWHCTQGKDRTGICTAAILMSLGCDEKSIIEDYMRYNKLFRVKNFLIYLAIMIFKFSKKKAKTAVQLITAQREYILAAFDEIRKRYGDELGFLKKGIGLSDGDIVKMQEIYLE